MNWYSDAWPPTKDRTWQQDFYEAAERGDSDWILNRCKSKRFQRSNFVKSCLFKSAIVRKDVDALKLYLKDMHPSVCQSCFLARFIDQTMTNEQIVKGLGCDVLPPCKTDANA